MAIIHAHLAELSGERVKITESKMLTDLVSGDSREVDTCLEASVAGHKIIVSIECRDWGRRQTVEWVEQALAKHSTLATNRLVLVSSSGFTGQAQSKAKANGITLLELHSDTDAIRAEIVGNLNSLWVKRFDLSPKRCKFVFENKNDDPNTPAITDTDVYRSDGTRLYPLSSLIETLIQSMNIDNDSMRNAAGSENSFTYVVEPALGPDPNSEETLEVYMKAETSTGPELRKAIKIEISGEVRVTVSEMGLKHGKLASYDAEGTEPDNAGHAYGTAEVGDTEILFVATETAEGQKHTSIRSTPISNKTNPKR